MILLDTDIIVDILRKHTPALRWMQTVDEQIALSGFSFLELLNGCERKTEQQKVERTLNNVRILWLSQEGCLSALEQFAKLHLHNDIGVMDILIAQIALENKLPLHTFNTKHFKAVPTLKTVQPYKK